MDRQTFDVAADLGNTAGHVPGRRTEAGGVIRDRQIVVHGFGDADHPDVFFLAAGIDLAAGIHGAVAAVHQHIADAVFLKQREHGLVLGGFQRIAAGADGRSRAGQQAVQLRVGQVGDIPQFFVQEAAGAAQGNVDPPHFGGSLCLPDRPVEGGVDDSGGAAAVHDNQIVSHRSTFLSSL